MSTAPQGPTDKDITAALDAIAARLVADVQQLSADGKLGAVSSTPLAAVGAFLLAYRRERPRVPVAAHCAPMARAVLSLTPGDRIALAQEFEVSLGMVDRWALGYATPHPEIAARVEQWCAGRAGAALADDTAPRLHIPRGLLDGAGG